MNPLLLRSTVIACALLVPWAALARADVPRSELARLVPDDVAVCLVLGDLRTQADKLKESGWLKKIRSSPLGQELADALEGVNLGHFGALLEKRLGVTWQQFRDEVLGDAVILAYQPGPPERPEDEKGVLLLQARNPELLAKLMQQLNDVQKKSGELKELQAFKHLGKTYFRRLEGDSEHFYHLEGGLLAFSGHEVMIKRVLARAAQPKAAALPPLAEHIRLAGAGKALATLWLNPRALDAELKQKFGPAKGPQLHVFQVFQRYWKALEGVSLSLTLEPEVEMRLALQATTGQLPPSLQRVVKKAGQPSELWSRFPKESVLTVAGRVDLAALMEVLQEWVPPEADPKMRKGARNNFNLNLGRIFLKELLKKLGPDCGLCLLPSATPGAPPEMLTAIRVPAGKARPVLFQTFSALVALAVAEHNLVHKDSTRVQKMQQGGLEVRYLVNDKKFPKGFRPAFALKEGYIVLASSPEVIRRFAAGAVLLPPTTEGTPLMRLSLPELTRLLKDQRPRVLELLEEKFGLPPELAVATLEELLGRLDQFEEVQLTQRSEGTRTLWLVRLRAAVKK